MHYMTLNLFHPVDVLGGVRVPANRGVLNYGTDVGLEAGCLNVAGAATEVPAQEGFDRVGFLCYSINVCVEAELRIQVNTQVLARVNHFKGMFTD